MADELDAGGDADTQEPGEVDPILDPNAEPEDLGGENSQDGDGADDESADDAAAGDLAAKVAALEQQLATSDKRYRDLQSHADKTLARISAEREMAERERERTEREQALAGSDANRQRWIKDLEDRGPEAMYELFDTGTRNVYSALDQRLAAMAASITRGQQLQKLPTADREKMEELIDMGADASKALAWVKEHPAERKPAHPAKRPAPGRSPTDRGAGGKAGPAFSVAQLPPMLQGEVARMRDMGVSDKDIAGMLADVGKDLGATA